jgi:hypothetical protein
MATSFNEADATLVAAQIFHEVEKQANVQSVANFSYSDQIKGKGSTIIQAAVVTPQRISYDPNTGIDPERLLSTSYPITIDNAAAYGWLVEDVDVHAGGAGDFLNQAGLAVANDIRYDIDTLLCETAVAGAGTTLASVSATSPSAAYEMIVGGLRTALFDHHRQGELSTVVSPEIMAMLLQDNRFVSLDIETGVIGKVGSMNVVESSALPDGVIIGMGTKDALGGAWVLDQFETFRSPTQFATVMRALSLSGAAVVRPESVAVQPYTLV